VLNEIKARKEKSITVELGLIGLKGIGFFRSLGLNIKSQHSGLGDNPTLEELI